MGKNDAPPPVQAFEIKTSKSDHGLKLIRPVGAPDNSPPIMTIIKSRWHKPNFSLIQGPPPLPEEGNPDPSRVAGWATLATFGSKADGQVRGNPLNIKMETWGAGCLVETPTLGKLKWKRNEKTAIGLDLFDGDKRLVAKLRVGEGWDNAQKILEIYVPGDDYFTEVVAISSMIVRELTQSLR